MDVLIIILRMIIYYINKYVLIVALFYGLYLFCENGIEFGMSAWIAFKTFLYIICFDIVIIIIESYLTAKYIKRILK